MFRLGLVAARALPPRLLQTRALRTTSVVRSDDHHAPPPPVLVGPGSAPGAVPTSAEQATGLERLQLLGAMEGVDIFDSSPIYLDRLGTLQDPIMVKTFGVSPSSVQECWARR